MSSAHPDHPADAPPASHEPAPRILVVLGHPRSESLCGALVDAYAEAARAAGAVVTVRRLADADFDLAAREPSLLRWAPDQIGREPVVDAMIAEVLDADHVVLVFPQWWGTYPALLKGYVDRVFLSQLAFAYRSASGAGWRKLLTGRTGRLIMTMDSPGWWDTLRYGRAAVRSLEHAVLWYCGVRTVGVTRLAQVRTSTPQRRAHWLETAARQGRRDASRRVRRRDARAAVSAVR
jgi:putative NADPH-quinone reductase